VAVIALRVLLKAEESQQIRYQHQDE